MPRPEIRLRLAVRRHGVPEVKLVWPCVPTDDLTIAKLLTQVNEVLPLESGQWGLEDYAVELADPSGGMFECLHFQQVSKVLKEDDQVIIRSLLTDDLKRRRLSGRHQISTDGKHLIDGLAFGRPWLRTPRDRPTLELPPRKRARITYGAEANDDDDDVEADKPPLLLTAPTSMNIDEPKSVGIEATFEGLDFERDAEYDSEADGDFQDDDLDDFEGQDLFDPTKAADELRFLLQDNESLPQNVDVEGSSSEDDDYEDDSNASVDNIEYPEPEGLDEEIKLLRQDNAHDLYAEDGGYDSNDDGDFEVDSKASDADDVDDLPTEIAAIRDELKGLKRDNAKHQTHTSHEGSSDDSFQLARLLKSSEEILRLPGEAISSQPPNGGARRPLIVEVSSSSNSKKKDHSAGQEDSDETSSSGSSSESESDFESEIDSSSDSSDSGSECDDDEVGKNERNAAQTVINPGGLDAGADDSSSSDTSSDDDHSDSSNAGAPLGKMLKESSDETSGDSSDTSSDSSDESDSSSEPDHGTPKTIKTIKAMPIAEQTSSSTKSAPAPQANAKPTDTNRAAIGPNTAAGQVAPGEGLTKTQKRNARRRELKRVRRLEQGLAVSEDPGTSAATMDAELLARKQALLAAVDDEQSHGAAEKHTDATSVQPAAVETTNDALATESCQDQGESEPPRRRIRMDLGAGRRLLFGALGLKNPKTKDDEENLKARLMDGIRPLQNARLATDESQSADATEQADEQEAEDPDAWKDKIIYRGVECCHDGIVLSEPPFPFVQRWDPQQKGGLMRKRKRSSEKFGMDDSYVDDSCFDDSGHLDALDSSVNGTARKKGNVDKSRKTNLADNMVLDYDETAKSHRTSSQFTDVDDLPSLPTDLSSLPFLAFSEIKAGMVVTWKTLTCSKATRYQPEYLSMTGLVLSTTGNGNVHVQLAKRDRAEDERVFDEETGERLYGKFDVPDSEEEDDDAEDDGFRDVEWTDMTEPRLVQREPATDAMNTSMKHAQMSNGFGMAGSDSTPRAARDELAHEGSASRPQQTSGDPNHHDRDESSIQSGQQVPLMDLTTLGDGSPSTSEGEDVDFAPVYALSEEANSPGRQLQETSQAAVEPSEGPVQEQRAAATRHEASAVIHHSSADRSGTVLAESPVETVVSNGARRPTDDINDINDIDGIDDAVPRQPYQSRISASPSLDFQEAKLSNSVSIPSGQPPTKGVTESVETGDSMIPETMVDNHRSPLPSQRGVSRSPKTPKTPKNPNTAKSARDRLGSSSPLPSAGTIFRTAATSRQSRSPLKLSQESATGSRSTNTGLHRGLAEELRGQPGSASGSEDMMLVKKEKMVPNATQPAPATGSAMKNSQHPRTRGKGGSPFVIPRNSQVIDLSSDSNSDPEALPLESYAEDSVDENWQPAGPGWTKKKKKQPPTALTNSKGGNRGTSQTRASSQSSGRRRVSSKANR